MLNKERYFKEMCMLSIFYTKIVKKITIENLLLHKSVYISGIERFSEKLRVGGLNPQVKFQKRHFETYGNY